MTILTTGVTGSLVARQEIRTMLQDEELFTLYILALARFQQTDQADLLSYFQIAGIHGRPYVAYDGATGVGNFGGYCTHSSILFPPWHRPFLALFEQALNKHVNDIANEYPAANKSNYIAAAKRFRIPYWDWALTADLPDVVANQHQLTVDTPQGVQTIPNPLYTYIFHPLYQDFGDGLSNEQVWEAWRETYRYPTSQTSNAQSDDTTMESTLDNNRLTIRDRTYNLLVNATDYAAFSNDGYLNGMGPTGYESLESIHNSIHGLTGRDGHMGVVDFSAFDPVFWLHHCAVDRVFAMWQALNPQSYVIPRENQGGTFATAAGTIEDANSPLAPFWKSQGEFWTAAEVRDTRTFNYTYPELANWANLDSSTKNARIRSDINAMYGSTAAWGTLNPGIFNVQPSVPIAAPPVSSFGTPAIPGKPAAHAVPAVSKAVNKAPEANVASSAGGSAQGAIKAPVEADSILTTLEEDAKEVRDKVAAAVHDVVEKVEGVVHPGEDEYQHKTPVDYKPSSGYQQAPPPTTYKPTPPVGYSEPPPSVYKPTPPTGYSEPPSGYKPTPPTGYSEPHTVYKPTPPGYKPTPPVETPTGYKPTPPTGYSEPHTGYTPTPVEPHTGYKPTPPTGYSEPPSGYKPTPPTGYSEPPSGYKPTPPTGYSEPPTGYKPTPPTGYSEPPTDYTPTPPGGHPTGYKPVEPPAGYKPTPPVETPTGYKPTPPVEYHEPPTTYKPTPPTDYKPPSDYHEPPTEYKPPPPTTYHEPPTTYNPAPPATYKPTPPTDYKPPSDYHEPPTEYKPPPPTTYHEPPTTYNPAPPATYKPTPPTDYKPPSDYHEPPTEYKPPPPTTSYEPPTTYNPAPPTTYKPTPPTDYKPPSDYHEPPTGYKPPPPTTYHEPPTTYNPAPPTTYKPTPPTDYKPPSDYHEPPTEYKPPPPTTYHEPPTTYNPAPPATYKPTPPTDYKPPSDYHEPPTGYKPPPPTTYHEPPTSYNPAPPTTYKPTPPTDYKPTPPTDYKPTPPTEYKPPSDYHEPPKEYNPPPPTTYHEPPTSYNPAPPTTYKPTPPKDYPQTPVGYQPPPTQYKPPTDYGKGPVDTGVVYAGKKDYIEWIANINCEKYAAKKTFFVYIFLGDFNDDPTKWAQDPNLVGIHVVFANNMTYTGCERCRDQAEQRKLVTGTIPLTGALGDKLGKSKVGSLETAEVIPYLKKELHWRIQTHDRKVIERADMPSLKVSVASIPVKLPENINEFPVWGQGSRQTEVTAGRPAGVNHGDAE